MADEIWNLLINLSCPSTLKIILEEMECHTLWAKEAGMLLSHMQQAADKLGLVFPTT